MFVYLAGPIDMADGNRSMHAQAETELGARRIAFFDPSAAYGAAQHDAVAVRNMNEAAIGSADGVLALMPDGVQTVGTPMEILSAHTLRKPVVVCGCTRSMQLAAMGIQTFPDDQIGEAIDALRQRVHSPFRPGGLFPSFRLTRTQRAFAEIGEAMMQHARPTIQWTGEESLEPTRQYPGDAGFDLVCSARTCVRAGDFADIPCNINVAFPRGVWGLITGRSSTLRRRGLLVHQGIIDQGYRGELFVGVFNLGSVSRTVAAGDRIAQLIPFPLTASGLTFKHTQELPEADRGTSGFGSTGV